VQLAWGPEEERFRAELSAFLDAETPHEVELYAADFAEARGGEIIPGWMRDWQATLFDNGWMIPGYPRELGGRDATPVQTLIYLEELASRRVPRSGHFPGYAIVAPSLLEFGTPEQRALAPAAIRGDTVWCIGMSEPDAGSDLAGLTTRATLRDDRFVVNGQKVWTSYAMVSQMCMCYVRTDPDAPKHRGISTLMIDMDTPGIEIRPLRHIHGSPEFAEVFFTDVEVPAENLLGDLNGGWRITQGSLAHERAGLWVEGVTRLESSVKGLVKIAERRGVERDPIVRRKVAEAFEVASSLRSLGYKGYASFAQGSSAPEHSYLKMASSEAGKAVFELGMEIAGAAGAITDGELGDEAGRWVRGFYMSFANTIAGGTSEIQRNIIAQRILGLPRS
jgi:alkylation response protein AidB-like acyl-CoA dehydrogenase